MEKARILIVEDEAIIAMELESQLQSLGYEVTSIVDTGAKAIEKAEADKPDLMLMDIRIKGEMDGIDAAKMIRNRFDIPVIFSTAYLDQERIERAKITMPFGYVLKPIQERDLKVTIEMALYVAKVDMERKKVEATLRFEKTRAQQYLDVAGVLLFALNVDGRVALINPKGCEILGYKQEEVIGRDWFDNFLPSEHIDEVKQIFNQIVNGDVQPVEYHENPIKRKDGSQRLIAWHNSILRDDVGEIIGLFSSGEDITEQKQAEEALIEKETKYRTLFEDSIDGLALVDPETGIILDCNQALAKLVDRTKVELIGQPQRILHPVADPEARFSPTFNNHKSDAQGKRVETQIITKSSELKEVVILARIYELDGKKIIHSIFRDVTVKIKAEQTFRR